MDQLLRGAVEDLYRELPEIACRCCGVCCVSPTCTLAEFVYLIDRAGRELGPKALAALLSAPPRLHPDYEGNSRCPFLAESRCAIHLGRTGACRLFGIPSLTHLNIEGMEQCRHGVEVIDGTGDIEFVRDWLSRLVALNEELYPFGAEPYFVRGLNIHCWMDIWCDELFDFDQFAEIRRVMTDNLDAAEVRAAYTPCTGLKEKVDKIGILAALIGTGARETIKEILLSIRDDYPLTGTYFYEEALEMLRVVEEE